MGTQGDTKPPDVFPEATAELKHVLFSIFDVKEYSPIILAFKEQGICDVPDILGMTFHDVECLEYTGSSNSPKKLILGNCGMIKNFIYMIRSSEIGRELAESGDYTVLTKKECDDFRTNPECGYLMVNEKETAKASERTPSSSTATKQDNPVRDFKKGVKTDPSA